MRSRLLNSCAAVATAAMLAFWLTLGGPQVVRADDPETAPPPGQQMVLVSAKSIDALEQRVIYLEQTVTALTESLQHVNTHRLCVSDDSGVETCITKAQLDSFVNQAPHAELNQPAVSEEAKALPPAAAIDGAAGSLAIVASPNLQPDVAGRILHLPQCDIARGTGRIDQHGHTDGLRHQFMQAWPPPPGRDC
jgi:hypothetical protein